MFARLAVLLLLAASAAPLRAQVPGTVVPGTEGVGLVERLGRKVPAGLTFHDDTGKEVALGSYLGKGKPVVLMLVYYDCPMLCNLLLDGFTSAIAEVPVSPGADYTVVTVSFEPTETLADAQRQKARHIAALGREGAETGWHFLTGSKPAILGLADAVGFEYRWDERSKQYAHPATLIFLAPDGTITRYLPGLTFNPRDVRLALGEASEGKVGTPFDSFLMLCFQYDADAGSYVPAATAIMKGAGAMTVTLLGLFLTLLWRRHKTASPLTPADA